MVAHLPASAARPFGGLREPMDADLVQLGGVKALHVAPDPGSRARADGSLAIEPLLERGVAHGNATQLAQHLFDDRLQVEAPGATAPDLPHAAGAPQRNAARRAKRIPRRPRHVEEVRAEL